MKLSFVMWAVAMSAILLAMVVAGRRGRKIEKALEETAADCLPQIGSIAEQRHQRRFGTSSPPKNGSWYPAQQSQKARPV